MSFLHLMRTLLLAAALLAAGGVQAADYVKVSHSGAFLPATATLGSGASDWACTYDRDTKLLWEVKTTDGGLRDWQKEYTNFDSTHDPNGKINADDNSIGFQKAVNDAGLCGFGDWRRPDLDELKGLLKKEQTPLAPTIDRDYFPNTSSTWYWSSTSYAPDAAFAWDVSFSYGFTYANNKANSDQVRLVRSGQLFDFLLSTAGDGAGVVSDASGIVDCTRAADGSQSGACATGGKVDIEFTLSLSLSAAPAADSLFAGWSGCDSETDDTPPKCQVKASASAAKKVTASFALKTYTVSAIPAEGGSVTCPADPVTHGDSAICTVSVNAGYTLDSVGSNCGGSLSGSSFTIDAVTDGCSVSARFSLNRYAIATSATPAAGGSVSCTPLSVTHGGSSTCTATAEPGYSFGAFSGDCSGPTCSLSHIQSNKTVSASFTQDSYTISASANPPAGGSVSCTPASVHYNGSSTCIATAKPGYSFGAFSGDCSGPTCSLSHIQSNKTVSASFNADGVKSFSGTTVPPAGGTPGPATASFTGGGSRCGFDSAATAFIAAPTALPAGKTLPQGLFKFKLTGCDDTPVAMKIEWPETVTSYIKYGKASKDAAASSYFEPSGLAIDGHTVSFSVRDGQKGDDDWSENGQIVDPSGPLADAPPPVVAEVTPIPTLGEWSLMLLGLLAAGMGMRRLRRG